MKLSPEAQEYVRAAVRRHLARSPAFAQLAEPRRTALAADMEAVSTDLARDIEPASAAGLLAEVDFPAFVAGLIGGTFDAVVDASLAQMEAYADLLAALRVESTGRGRSTVARPPTAAGAATVARPLGDAIRLRLRARALARRPGRVDIDLPDLDAGGGTSPVRENIRAVAALYLVRGFEDLGLFAVVDRLAELVMTGDLHVSGTASEALYRYTRDQHARLAEDERRALYDRTLDPAGGVPDGFDARWRRFLADVQAAVAGAPADPRPPHLQDPVRASGLALAHLVSERGQGSTLFLAQTLCEAVRRGLEILDSPAIAAALGARDRWQVLDRVATLHLGTTPNHPQHLTRATAGAAILEWLAAHLAALPADPLLLAPLEDPTLRWFTAEASLLAIATTPPDKSTFAIPRWTP